MATNWKKFTASSLLATAIILCLYGELRATEKVVVLAPAAADILKRLGADAQVVGVTNSVSEFPGAVKVGTHLNPGVETIASLKPGLIIATSRFNPELARRMGASLFIYEPKSLDEIIQNVRLLASRIGKAHEGELLAKELQAVLDDLDVPARRPTVLYETRSIPLSVAGTNSIVTDLLERAGMQYAWPHNGGTLSAEYLMTHQPEFYIYQQGPMNKNPVPPPLRSSWENFRACLWKVNEFDFARPNTTLFETVRILNSIINSENPCVKGKEIYQ